MNIKNIVPYFISYPDSNDFGGTRSTVLVKVETAEGFVGWGEGVAMWKEACLATCTLITEGLAPLLTSTSDLTVESAWELMRKHTWWYGEGGITCFAISAIDMALWDIQGKIVSQPLYQLLGGKQKNQLPAYASCHVNKESHAAVIDEIKEFQHNGFKGVKLGFAKKGLSDIGKYPDQDIIFIQKLRNAVGNDFDILADAGNGVVWDLETAIRVALAFEKENVGWLEEPLYPTNWDDYLKLKEAVKISIASGEREWTVTSYKRLIESKTADIVGIDPARSEGITGFRTIDLFADNFSVRVNAHAWSTAILSAASLHLSIASKNTDLFEFKPYPNPVLTDLVNVPVWHKDGYVHALESPGLSLEVDEEVVHKYLVK